MTERELIERVMTEHWDFGACPCAFCEKAREMGYGPKSRYPTNPKVSILNDGDHKLGIRPTYDWEAKS
jgi:hypothetical protein